MIAGQYLLFLTGLIQYGIIIMTLYCFVCCFPLTMTLLLMFCFPPKKNNGSVIYLVTNLTL